MTLHIISAGAAQSVVQQVIDAWKQTHRGEVAASFGAVGAQCKKLLDGAPADIVLLTAAMIDELIANAHLVDGTRIDLGAVVGGIAVCAGVPHPEVARPEALASALCAASAIHIPDPAIATAGAQFVRMCEGLGIAAAVQPKLRTFPNGFAAMTQLAADADRCAIGCTQITEIKWVRGVELVGPLPQSLQVPTVYSLGIAARSADPNLALDFARELTGPAAGPMLAAAGFGMG
jgi:molybdate transport system substrate-binding protein